MATLNLGRIKPVFRGAWTSGAYVIDDIVTHGNETFICIQAGSNIATTNASYWSKLASKGTDGTDVGTIITTQGDILYRDGSGLQRLAKGTATQVLAINSGATAPEWVDASGGKTLGVTQFTNSTRTSLSSGDTGNFFSTNYTQIKANSKLRIDVSIIGFQPNQGSIGFEFVYDGTTYTGFGIYTYTDHAYQTSYHYSAIIDGASSTGSKAWVYRWNHYNNASGVPFNIWNPTNADDARIQNSTSRVIITELDI